MGGIIDLILIIYAFWTHNFLFAVIIIIASFIVILHDSSNPEDIEFSITTSGLILGKKFYDYDEVKDFAVVYKPNKNLKRLYFELKAPFAHRLSIPLQEQDPLPIREHLLKYLLEDLERKDESVSEAFARTFKI